MTGWLALPREWVTSFGAIAKFCGKILGQVYSLRVLHFFGETLRHELNNPLTGILGNAELLLAEVRRKNDGQLPNGGQQRLETIAALAVRLRETVRRLSQDWESRHRRVPQRPVQQRVAHLSSNLAGR